MRKGRTAKYASVPIIVSVQKKITLLKQVHRNVPTS